MPESVEPADVLESEIDSSRAVPVRLSVMARTPTRAPVGGPTVVVSATTVTLA